MGCRRYLVGCLTCFVTQLALVAIGSHPVAAAGDASGRPSVLLILTDDEDLMLHTTMPKTRALLEEEGTTFSNYFVTYSLCAPSRATILRGQYPHNHNVEGNILPTGGYKKFKALGLEESTVATWLAGAGYHTALVGKYLNDYSARDDPPAAGWQDWMVMDTAYYNYYININNSPYFVGNAGADYAIDRAAREAVTAIEHAVAQNAPLFLEVAPYGPHAPATPAARYARTEEREPLPRLPGFDEADVSDKPAPIRNLASISLEDQDRLEAYFRKRVRTMRAVDDMVERLIAVLASNGRLPNTYIIYTSDNGFHMGEHRVVRQKTTPYEESIHVPLIVRGPGVPAARRVEQLVINNDLAPTIAAMAGVEPPPFVDGRSFLGLLTQPDLPWRRSFLIERRETEGHELIGAATFDAIRTAESTYVEYGNGEREFYDLARDPYQLDNRIAAADPKFILALSQRLAELKNCAAANCRLLEDLPIGSAAP